MLDGKVCVVTGAGAGIGRETAVEMARRGARTVVAADLREESAAETAELVGQAGADSLGGGMDVSSSESVRSLMDATAARFGGIDVLHNNAGIHEATFTEHPRLEDIDEDAFDLVYRVNLKGVWLCIKHATLYLKQAKNGAIVNASSLSGL